MFSVNWDECSSYPEPPKPKLRLCKPSKAKHGDDAGTSEGARKRRKLNNASTGEY
jgi:hypothetical protein